MLSGKQPEGMNVTDLKDLETRASSTIRMCLTDEVMYHVMDEKSPASIWLILESQYTSKSLMNKLFLRRSCIVLRWKRG